MVPCRLGAEEFSVSLSREMVERVCRSGDGFCGELDRQSRCGGDFGELYPAY